MASLGSVSSALIARNESWVRKEANSLARRLPSNVEKADLIQVGLIAVAHAALLFEWEGEADSPAGKEAFVGYARLRVRGAMIDELRQMDHLQRDERRRLKALQIARDRWRTTHGTTATLAEMSTFCSIDIAEIARLDALPASLQSDRSGEGDAEAMYRPIEATTDTDEVEARVDTAIILRRLESYFSRLPARDMEVIDAYMGIGVTPTQLARALNVTPARVSQLYKAICAQVARHFGNDFRGVGDRRRITGAIFEQHIAAREARAAANDGVHWGALIEHALTGNATAPSARAPMERRRVA